MNSSSYLDAVKKGKSLTLVGDRQVFSLLFCYYHKQNTDDVIPAYINLILKWLLKSRTFILNTVGLE